MAYWKNYNIARSIPDALQALGDPARETRLIAGGTDLLLDIQQDRQPPTDTLIDVTNIPEMQLIEVRQGEVFIGAAAPLNKIFTSPILAAHSEALIDAVGLIGGPQVRNAATLGGNVAHALPAADGTIALLAFDAFAEIAFQDGFKRVPVETLFRGPGKSALDPKHEILVGFTIKLRKPGQGSAFRRVMRPQGVAIAILNFAVWIERENQTIKDIRISCGPAGPVPFRAHAAEKSLSGSHFNNDSIKAGIEMLQGEVSFRTSPHRATKEYRMHLAGILLADTIRTAWKRAGSGFGMNP